MPRLHRPSPAMLVALVALFIGLGSSAVAVQLSANSVLSKHIKDGLVKRADLANNSVITAQVADGSLLGADFKAGQLPSGPTGPQGAQGPKGDTGVTAITVRANAGPGAVAARCNPGEVAVGGGAHSYGGIIAGTAPLDNPLGLFTTGMPAFVGYTPTAWSGRAVDGNLASTDVTVWVVCAAM